MDQLQELIERFHYEDLLLPVWLEKDRIFLINQKKLPTTLETLTIKNVDELVSAIKNMTIRGSGAIGISGAYGMYLAAVQSRGDRVAIQTAAKKLKSSRPTAVNLVKTINEILLIVEETNTNIVDQIEEKLIEVLNRQLTFEFDLGKYGAELIDDGDTILTHCHSGALAGSGYGGRALSVLRKAKESGKDIHVYVCETRPYLQGARITAFELKKFGIPFTLITDNMSGYFMRKGDIQKVVVGSDRITSHGDLANKVGTYMHAIAAKENNIPFYTATSNHTIDSTISVGDDIEIEYRNGAEVTSIQDKRIAPEGTKAVYPSFDITPHHLVTGIITEKGVITPPYDEKLHKVVQLQV
ncbi:S-methyl-5-thioribose-1-phosphate isomerase [Alteribacillus iranensis]|uniref:Methylthioribose-1-phosphate isomerase n=1 Tax=Alteribacillus iranensis TaxID=930128 RepID=A0A1I2BD87_9BACI|nr:S-methyl-5-thioribose-1-phosphate isomerase [Alteribacillus iranensis]SFE53947.1 methylthioribose-1-phosphate isomerase [Alteribacillus iranensis]